MNAATVHDLATRQLLLSRAEIEALTGRTRGDAQARWLVRNGWPHQINAGGRVVIARAEFERRLVAGPATSTVRVARPRKEFQPNLSAIQRRP